MDRMAGQGIRSVSLATTATDKGRAAAPILPALHFWRTGNRDHRPLDAATSAVRAAFLTLWPFRMGGQFFALGVWYVAGT